MRLLLDTHSATWAALDPKWLSNVERRWMAEADTPIVFSAVAVWESRLKWHSFHVSGERKRPVDPSAAVAFAAAIDWELLSLTAHHAKAELSHPLAHKDPFDELLLIQAQEAGLRLLIPTG